MGDLIGSLNNYYKTSNSASGTTVNTTNSSAGSTSLSMTDFLSLMVAEFQNQDMDNTASTTDMMNQMVQMSVMQAVSNVSDATTMLYASSLVGKEVTIGQYDKQGNLEEVVGTVTGTGTYNDEQVIFVNGQLYSLSDIMAIGTLPEKTTSATT